MRILFSGLPTHGHIYPLIPLALAARDAGHEVLCATDAAFHRSVQEFGLETAATGTGTREVLSTLGKELVGRESLTPEQREELVAEVFGTVLPRAFMGELEPLLERVKPHLVVHEAATFGALFAAKRAGIPAVCHAVGRSAPLRAEVRDRLIAVAEDAGVSFSTGSFWGGGDVYVDIYPASMQGRDFLETANRIPLRPIPVNEPAELPGWVLERDRRRPLVYLTLGTAFGVVDVLRQAIDGLVRLDVDVLVAAGPTVDVGALGGVPANVKVEAWVPQAELLPHVDLVVHHGGSGTTLGALASGVPQLVVPQGADQYTNADAVATAGVGAQLLRDDFSAEAVAATARHLLADGSFRGEAEQVALEIAAMPTPSETVPLLVDLADDIAPV